MLFQSAALLVCISLVNHVSGQWNPEAYQFYRYGVHPGYSVTVRVLSGNSIREEQVWNFNKQGFLTSLKAEKAGLEAWEMIFDSLGQNSMQAIRHYSLPEACCDTFLFELNAKGQLLSEKGTRLMGAKAQSQIPIQSYKRNFQYDSLWNITLVSFEADDDHIDSTFKHFYYGRKGEIMETIVSVSDLAVPVRVHYEYEDSGLVTAIETENVRHELTYNARRKLVRRLIFLKGDVTQFFLYKKMLIEYQYDVQGRLVEETKYYLKPTHASKRRAQREKPFRLKTFRRMLDYRKRLLYTKLPASE